MLHYIVGYWSIPRETRTQEYGVKFSPLLEGTKYDDPKTAKKYLILMPTLYFVKRLLFASLLVGASEYLWVQVALLNFSTLASLMYVLWYMPLESTRANLFEVFNDVTLLLLTYLLWCFTDWIVEPETRHELGFIFIAISLGNVALHLFTMVLESLRGIKEKCKQRIARKMIEK